MNFGVYYFPTHYSMNIGDLAYELEARNFNQLLACEHTHIPLSRKTPFPGGDLPEMYKHTLDPFVSLSFAATQTKELKVGTGICLLPQRDTIATAKSVASIDRLSNGRFIFGVGAGWNQDEMENHGILYKDRFKIMEEKIEALKKLWTEEEASYKGNYVNFDPVWCSPKPVTNPHPPVILGGETDHTLKRVVTLADGWLPRADAKFDPFKEKKRLDSAAISVGRSPESLSMTVFRAPTDRDQLQRYKEAGVTTVLLDAPSESRENILPILDKYTELMK